MLSVTELDSDKDLIEAARLAVRDNRAKRRASERRSYFYYICPRGRDSRDEGCDHNKHHPAVSLEEQVWEVVSSFLSDPERMRRGLEHLVAAESQKDRELEAAFTHCADILVKTETKIDRLLDLYLEGHLGKDRYDERVRTPEAEAQNARGEREKLRARRQMIAQTQSDMEELVDSYAEALPNDLAFLAGSERHEVYGILGLRVNLDNSGMVELGGVVALPQFKDHIETCPET